jgi:hypothetical protein
VARSHLGQAGRVIPGPPISAHILYSYMLAPPDCWLPQGATAEEAALGKGASQIRTDSVCSRVSARCSGGHWGLLFPRTRRPRRATLRRGRTWETTHPDWIGASGCGRYDAVPGGGSGTRRDCRTPCTVASSTMPRRSSAVATGFAAASPPSGGRTATSARPLGGYRLLRALQ